MRIPSRARSIAFVAYLVAACACASRPVEPSAPPRARARPSSVTSSSIAFTPEIPAPIASTSASISATESAPELEVDDPADDPSRIAADAYGALDDGACLALLKQRGVPFVRVDEARGVETPVRFVGPLHGVDLHGGEPIEQRETSPSEIVDCRLALALDDFAQLLEAHQVIEAVHWSIYRAPPAGPGPLHTTDHPAALAIDLGALFESDGSRTGVMEDWHGAVGEKTCKGASVLPTKRARRLRSILCEVAAARIFHVVLTPNFNAAHHDHFHLEIKRSSTFSFVR